MHDASVDSATLRRSSSACVSARYWLFVLSARSRRVGASAAPAAEGQLERRKRRSGARLRRSGSRAARAPLEGARRRCSAVERLATAAAD